MDQTNYSTRHLFQGNFSCHVWNDAGDGEYVYNISVYALPSIVNFTQIQTMVKVTEATNFSIECPANGVPFPKVREFNFFVMVQ